MLCSGDIGKKMFLLFSFEWMKIILCLKERKS